MNRLSVILILCLTTSCQSYKTVFDCPPGEGVPCTSVTQIEKMIIESDEGPDIFVREKMSPYCAKKIWVNDNPDECGSKGYYIYIPD